MLNVEGCRARGESLQKVNLRCYREQVLTSFTRDVRTSPAGMQDLVKQDLRGVGDDFECAMKGTDNVISYCGEGKVLQRGINGIRLGRERRSRMLVHRVDVAEGGRATLLRPCIAGFDIGRG